MDGFNNIPSHYRRRDSKLRMRWVYDEDANGDIVYLPLYEDIEPVILNTTENASTATQIWCAVYHKDKKYAQGRGHWYEYIGDKER